MFPNCRKESIAAHRDGSILSFNAEMGRAKLSIKSLSELTGINYETLKLKFRGVTEFKLCEMVEIKRKAFPDKTLDYLFATDETGSEEGRE